MAEFCKSQGIDLEYFLSHSHGVRTQDNLRRFQKVPVPGDQLTEEQLDEAVKLMEYTIAENGRKLSEAGGRGITRLPGVTQLLDKLREGNARWGICTSATTIYASSALTTSEIGSQPPQLPFLITANHVTHGKPHPEPYLKGMEALKKLGGADFTPEEILVFEDAPSGLKSGLAAGCKTLAVCTGQPREKIRAIEATIKTVDLTRYVPPSFLAFHRF
jgi:HAD superfamily hydrolase (TIGR01509 family)